MTSTDTPLIQQWREVKSRHPDALVFFRVGDFYEMFNEDAEEGARLLGLTLTSRNNGSSRAPLAGVPAQALDTYLERLVRLGRRVAICEQVEDPSAAKGIVRREVVETVTPGAVLSDGLLEARRNNYLVALAGASDGDGDLGLASADLSTGELLLQRVTRPELADVLGLFAPSELLLPRAWQNSPSLPPEPAVQTFRGDWLFDLPDAEEELRRCFGVLNLEGFGLGPGDELLIGACGALISYLTEVQPGGAPLRAPRIRRGGDLMRLDEMTRRNLELVEPLRGGGSGTLLEVLDLALTPMGGRLLRQWLLAPLLRCEAIQARQSAVAELVEHMEARRALRAALREVRDLERLAVKVASGRIAPRELLNLAASLERVPELCAALGEPGADLLCTLLRGLDDLPEVRDEIRRAIDPEAPLNPGEAGVIRAGYDAELDELRATRDGAVGWIARLQAQERERTGIGSLKVGFNRVFGYYIEVTRANLDRVPDDYQRRQTLASAERYVTPELKLWEERILGAEERISALEARLFAELRGRLVEAVSRLQELAGRIATLDVLSALAETAVRRGYVRPEVSNGFGLEIRGGRHPVVETMMPSESFIPNDVVLREDTRIMILTGPNMAGKSTVLRQVGLIVLLAQIGSFVPAREARIGIADRIFTRVGASDNLVRGQSTFMVEMSETAAILHGATARSLVLLDEIGRGTSTWDGLSVATAVTEHLHERTGAKTIFATHYHELTGLADRLSGIVNFRVEVREEEDRILFMRRLVAGGADRSYGVEVARLAGLPTEVVQRARQLLGDLENGGTAVHREPPHGTGSPLRSELQLPLFEPPPHPAVERLRDISVERTTPIEALNLLAELAALANS